MIFLGIDPVDEMRLQETNQLGTHALMCALHITIRPAAKVGAVPQGIGEILDTFTGQRVGAQVGVLIGDQNILFGL